ncbi:MAG: PQQ-like beta-propeller repeat protein [Actinomycetia bacterium]|nr:PQQ-like beta-propeller repeat protein [Actinomycetes bacterium]
MRPAPSIGRSLGVVVLLLVLTAACARPTIEHLAEFATAAPGQEGGLERPDPVWVTSDHWAQEALGPAFSDVKVVDGVAIYEVVQEGRVSVVGVEGATGEVLYRLPTDPAGRLRGVTSEVFASAEAGVFVRRFIAEINGDYLVRLSGHKVRTGELLWTSRGSGTAGDPFACGPHLCLRGDLEQVSRSLSDGELVGSMKSSTGRVYTRTSDGFMLLGGGSLSGATRNGFEVSWVIPFSEIADELGYEIPEGEAGWGVVLDAKDRYGAIYYETEELVHWIGFDRAAGRLTWTETIEGSRCFWSDETVDFIVECEEEADGSYSISDRSIIDGSSQWSTDVGPSEWVFVSHRDGLLQVDTEEAITYLDPYEGTSSPAPPLFFCSTGGSWPEIEWWWETEPTSYSYRAVDHPVYCNEEWRGLGLAELVDLHPEGFRSVTQEAGDGWFVGVDFDGVLVGVRTDS